MLRSPHANAKVTSLDLDAARAVPGVRCVLGPGDGPENGDSPLSDAPDFAGGAIAAVAADSADAAEAALEALAPQFEVLGFVSGIDEAFEKQDFLVDPTEHVRGDAEAALAAADVTVEADVPRARPAPQLDGAARRRRRLARGRAHRLELDPGHLRRPGDPRRGVRARARARPRDLRVHGRRVRLEVRAWARRGSWRPSSRAARAGRCGS